MKINRQRAFFIFLIVALSLVGCTPKQSPEELTLVTQEQWILGTFGQINAYSPSEKSGNEIIAKAYERIREIENLMSTSILESDIYRVNKNAGGSPVQVNPLTMDVILKAMEYHSITKETFNIGLGSLIELWGIGKEGQKVPSPEEIIEAKAHIDLNNLVISKEDNTVFLKDPSMLLDLGGIAKGYAVDEAVRILKDNGVKSGVVSLGGDIYAIGTKTDGSQWRVGITRPEIGASDSIARILISDKSVVTSGNYERYFIEDDVLYHHIIDPKTGQPANTGLSSVTIVSGSSMEGDILSTATFVLGLDEGLKLIEGLSGVEGILITKDKQVYLTTGLKGQVEILDHNFKIAN